jgi:hypothetical protein
MLYTKCGVEIKMHFSADGSPIQLADVGLEILSERSTQATTPMSWNAIGISDWESTADGRIVARSCGGVVVKEYFDHLTAATVRQRSRNLVI